jgi:hypothetical protein
MPLLHDRSNVVLVGVVSAAVLASAFACGANNDDVHQTADAKSGNCVSCHQAAYQVADNPTHVSVMPQTCRDCHATNAWSPAGLTIAHTWFPLQNKHAGVDCASCHTTSFRAGETSKDCQGCHKKDYDTATDPPHAGFPIECATCHTDTGFKPASYKHDIWPLDGAHATTACAGCHTGSPARYQGTPTACADCHQKDADGATNPSHKGFPTTCADCHTAAAGWQATKYIHKWPLQGKHIIVPCNSCHTGNPPKYQGTSTDCYGCHQAAADASTFPNHNTFPHTCLDCHVMTGWSPAIGGQHPEAKFPLTTGKHADPGIKCQDCHVLEKGISAGGTNTDCVNCHLGAHVEPDIDTKHLQLAVPQYPVANGTTNFCLACHPAGTK